MLPVLTSKMCKKKFYKVASYKLGNYTGGGGEQTIREKFQ